jgi:hypothetical protein
MIKYIRPLKKIRMNIFHNQRKINLYIKIFNNYKKLIIVILI